jgi:hypothetical protein
MLVEGIRMKAWKIITVAALSVIAVAMIATTAFAYYSNGQGTYTSNGSSVSATAQERMGSMMHRSMRGQMGWGYSQYSNYASSSGYPQQNSTPQQYGSMVGGCGMRNRWP